MRKWIPVLLASGLILMSVIPALSKRPTTPTPTPIAVPADYPTIQAAINAAVNGDTVLVSAGTYPENINFIGKAITVKSEGGAQATIIDGGAVDAVVSFVSGEGTGSVIDGFTITNGNAYRGGGIHCAGTSPTISNCTITLNTADDGGGIGVEGGAPVISKCVISDNTALYCGGGVLFYGAAASQVKDCIISRNSSGAQGGGLHYIYSWQNIPTVTNTIITMNTSPYGGGLTAGSSNPVFTNCTFSGNSNWAAYLSNASPTFQNCILYFSSALSLYGDAAPVVSYSNIQGGWAGAGTGNIDADPLFTAGGCGDFASDYYLQASSPCVNTASYSAAPSTDICGTSRGRRPDMGAYEFVK